MTGQTPDDAANSWHELFKREGWRSEVELRRLELARRLDAAAASSDASAQPKPWEDQAVIAGPGLRIRVSVEEAADEAPAKDADVRAAHIAAARASLANAHEAIKSDVTLRSWWSGSSITVAWESVHAAAGELVALQTADAVRVGLPRLRDWIAETMPKGSTRKRYETTLDAMIAGQTPLDRTVVRQAHEDALHDNNERHANLRTLRNLLLATSFALMIVLIGLGIWHAINTRFISLCTSSAQCFAAKSPRPADVFAVEAVGALGGLLSVAFAVAKQSTPPSRYNVRAAQALLKPAAGAATALIGVLLLQSRLVISPVTTTLNESVALAYAAVFGFSQQLLTQFVDKRADKLLGGEKDTAT